LEEAANEYAEIRDERIALNAREVKLKQGLLALMKAHHKEHYQRDGIEITIVHEDENVKVRIKKEDEATGGE